MVGALLAAQTRPLRGAAIGLGAAAKFAPLALAPLFANAGRATGARAVRWSSAWRWRAVLVAATAPFVPDGGLRELYDRTVGYQAGRPVAVQPLGPGALARLAADRRQGRRPWAWPCWWRSSRGAGARLRLAALAAAVLIALQLAMTHWFYLYIVWFAPLVLVALFAPLRSPAPAAPARGPAARTLAAA